MNTNYITVKTSMGYVSAEENKGKIYSIKFLKRKIKKTNNKILLDFKKNLFDFFSKKTKKLNISCKIFGNINQKRVWNEIIKIKYGKTKTYGEIGKKLKLSPRYVGKICGQNNLLLFIPCHRVIRSDGKLGGFSAPGGINFKKKLLKFENPTFQ